MPQKHTENTRKARAANDDNQAADNGAATRGGEDRHFDTPYARKARRTLREHEKPDQLAERERKAEDRQEALIDEGLEESFPSSDPPSVKRIT